MASCQTTVLIVNDNSLFKGGSAPLAAGFHHDYPYGGESQQLEDQSATWCTAKHLESEQTDGLSD